VAQFHPVFAFYSFGGKGIRRETDLNLSTVPQCIRFETASQNLKVLSSWNVGPQNCLFMVALRRHISANIF